MYFVMYDCVDIVLDIFLYVGMMMICEFFYMGVFVLTFVGACYAYNVGKSLMIVVGFERFVVKDVIEYV